MAHPPWLRAAGDLFFRHRNRLFPLVLISLWAIFPPRLAGGSLAADRGLDLLGLGVALAGQALRAAVIGLAYIKRGGRNKRVYASSLVTGGMFGVCRNPLYLANGLIVAGLLIVHGNPWSCLLGLMFFGVAYRSIVAAEESFLLGKFGDAYRDYCRTVPRWWPDLTRLAAASRGMAFDWRRVIVNDYGTLFTWLSAAAALLVYEGAGYGNRAAGAPRLWTCGAVIVAAGAFALAVRRLKKSGRVRLARN